MLEILSTLVFFFVAFPVIRAQKSSLLTNITFYYFLHSPLDNFLNSYVSQWNIYGNSTFKCEYQKIIMFHLHLTYFVFNFFGCTCERDKVGQIVPFVFQTRGGHRYPHTNYLHNMQFGLKWKMNDNCMARNIHEIESPKLFPVLFWWH